MVGALHRDGLRVVLDQVFNHTAGLRPGRDSQCLDKVVPGYYQRLNAAGAVETSTCCQNVATEHADGAEAHGRLGRAVGHATTRSTGSGSTSWATTRKANMLAVRAALDELTLAKDGVDGKTIYLYGEGWNFGEVANNARFEQATQGQLGGTGIGTFSDRLRDAVRGGGPFDERPAQAGLRQRRGSPTPTATATQPRRPQPRLAARHRPRQARAGRQPARRSPSGSTRTARSSAGDEVDYNGAPAGYADQPDEVISYVDAHDNETLFDSLDLQAAGRPPRWPTASG